MNLILAVTGATGAYAAQALIEKSPWPVSLIVSDWGQDVYQRECGDIKQLTDRAERIFKEDDLSAAAASGSVPTVGMVILPCSCNTLAKVAGGIADSLITRAAHCHLKEKRKLVVCVRESPWSLIDLENAARLAAAGAVVMPLSPPYYMMEGRDPASINLQELMEAFADRVLSALGHSAGNNWETIA